MKRIATFEIVTKDEFKKALDKQCNVEAIQPTIQNFWVNDKNGDVGYTKLYNVVELPKRKTKGSAGYDFVCPFDVCLLPGQELVIPTGIKCRMDDGWVLKVYPRSGLGFKYRCRLANTVGVIDADYYNNPDNEGHILIKIVNEGNKKMELHEGDSFVQGIFSEFGITTDDDVEDSRVGGVGSTGR